MAEAAAMPGTAMVLAAGLGTRMRPITDRLPKPLVRVAGKALIDWGLDALASAGVGTAVVNVHHLADLLEAHLGGRTAPRIVVSDERARLLDSGGGIVKALPELGHAPFFVLNADTFWIDRAGSGLEMLARTWDSSRMDMLLMLADPAHATGHGGTADFVVATDGRLHRAHGDGGGLIYAGAAIADPRMFEDASPEPHSLNRHFDAAIASGRLYGAVLDGDWITVGTPEAIAPAEEAVGRARRGGR